MKRNLWISTIVLMAMLLSACSAAVKSTPAATEAATEAVTATGDAGTDASAPAECRVDHIFTEQPEVAEVLPPVTDADWKLGPDDAFMTLIEYSDFQCPYCMQTSAGIKQFVKDHEGEVQLVYRHYPLSGHANSTIAAQAAEAAGLQGKFWEMHALLFDATNWQTWIEETTDGFVTWVVDQAASIDGLDVDQFAEDLQSEAIVQKVADAKASAEALQIPGTPSVFVLINGKVYFSAGQVSADSTTLQMVYDLWKFSDREYDACPPTVIDSTKSYTATLETTKGNIVIELYADKAPMAVNSFVFLARQGWYNNISWHRVVTGFVAQSGDPSGTGAGGPGFTYGNELSDLKFDQAGMVGSLNGSQFFITMAANSSLDGTYTVMGKVIEGMDVVESLTPRDPQKEAAPADPDMLISVTIEEN